MKDLFNEIDNPRLKKVKFIVFGSDAFDFWQQYHDLLNLKQDMMGLSIFYHKFSKNKKCHASLQFYDVEGVWTLFVDACGAYQDWFKLEEFVFKLCGMKPNPNNHCNEDNFHNHIAWNGMDCKERKKRLKHKYTLDLEEAKRNLDRLEEKV